MSVLLALALFAAENQLLLSNGFEPVVAICDTVEINRIGDKWVVSCDDTGEGL